MDSSVDPVDWHVRAVGVASGKGRGSNGPWGLTESILARVRDSDDVCSAEKITQGGKMGEVDKESGAVRRVLNTPRTGGHGGQMTSKESSHGPKAPFEVLGVFKAQRST